MSRCFPFPPPGYEKKIRTDEADSLLKEKHKEKKHKKDKEKREGKEKKDKESSKDKHKERKDKKEKHKDRKDKDRSKEKSRTSEDKKDAIVLPNTGGREKLVINTSQNNGNGEFKFVQDLARRINEEEATESQSARKINLPRGVSENNISCPVPQTNHTKDEERRNNSHRNFPVAKRPENAALRGSSCMEQKAAKVMVKPVEKNDQAKKTELQEKNHRRESVTKSDTPFDKEGIKKSDPKYTTERSSKEKKDEKTVINKTGQEKPKFVEGGPRLKESKHDAVDIRNVRMPELSRASVKNPNAEGILGKRKDPETNGFLYENGFRPNKIQKPVASPISSVENGRKLGASQTLPKPNSELQGIVCNPEVKKDQRINGFIDSQEPKSRPPVKVKENGEASSKKRPHSDLKYLDQILNVPKMEELDVVDDDEKEWLFGQSGVKSLKKQETYSSSTSLDETKQVWNQALRIESADVVALPYVVPF